MDRLAFPKTRRTKDKRYTEYVRSLPCCITSAPGPSDPHHSDMGHGTMGGKCSDYRQVPLAHRLHVELHQHGERAFWQKWGIDVEQVIERNQAEYVARGGKIKG